MSQRSLTRRQRWRVDKVQKERLQRVQNQEKKGLDALNEGHLGAPLEGQVTAHFGRQVEVEASASTPAAWAGAAARLRQLCYLRANLEGLVTGDRVTWRPGLQPDQPGVVEARQARSSLLARPDAQGKEKAIAANVDQLVLVIAPEPEPFAHLIDRYLVAAENRGLRPLLLINKWDQVTSGQVSPALAARLERFLTVYQSIGYRVLTTSTQDAGTSEALLEALQEALKDQISVFVGQSGVGKSSLINRLLPGVDLRVGGLSKDTRQGRHTTTTARLFHFPQGGQLIDSPGIRELTLTGLKAEALAEGFREFHPFLGRCRFRDCSHQREPGCALQQALAQGQIHPERFHSFLTLLQVAL